MTNTAAYPLVLLYRLMHYSGGAVQLDSGYKIDPGRAARIAAFEALVAARPDLYTTVAQGGKVHLVRDERAKLPTLEQLSVELTEDYRRNVTDGRLTVSTMELTAAVLAKGTMPGDYGNYFWAGQDAALHVLTCGADWDRFEGVTSERWREWGGTFGEDTYDDMLEVRLTCRCGVAEEATFGLVPPSIAKLIVTLSAGQLEKLFEND